MLSGLQLTNQSPHQINRHLPLPHSVMQVSLLCLFVPVTAMYFYLCDISSWTPVILSGRLEFCVDVWYFVWMSGSLRGCLVFCVDFWCFTWTSAILHGCMIFYMDVWCFMWTSGILRRRLVFYADVWYFTRTSGILRAVVDITSS